MDNRRSSIPPEPDTPTPWPKAFRGALLEVYFPGILVLLFIVGGLAVELLRIQPGMMRPVFFYGSYFFFPFWGLYAVAAIVAWYRWRQRTEGRWEPGKEGWRVAWEDAGKGALSRTRLATLVVVCLFLPLLLNTFGSWKLAIPMWGGFAREAELVEISCLLHGGLPAWHRLQPVLEHPVLTAILDRVYYSWLPVMMGLVLWQAVWREPEWERRRFLLAFTLVWLGLGVVVATAGASAGPIFIDRVLPESELYNQFLAYLDDVNREIWLRTLEMKEEMWPTHGPRPVNPAVGISAFPSIHVAMTALFACALWGTGRIRVLLAIVYMFLISLASIHLGWHYAVDAYAGALGAVGCWYLAGFWLRRFPGPGGFVEPAAGGEGRAAGEFG